MLVNKLISCSKAQVINLSDVVKFRFKRPLLTTTDSNVKAMSSSHTMVSLPKITLLII